MNMLPIVRFSQKEYLEELQQGHLFMRNIAYYQQYDKTDTVRSDQFDGSLPSFEYIPHPYEDKVIPSSGHFMRFNSFITCFFHYQHIYNDFLIIPPASVQDLKLLNCSYALVVNTDRFIDALQSHYNESTTVYGDVSYSENQLRAELAKYIPPAHPTHIDHLFEFIKRDSFKNQQEFRVCIMKDTPAVKLFEEGLSKPIAQLSEKHMSILTNSTLTLDIGSIKDFSQIIPTDILFNYSVGIKSLNIGY